MDELQDSNLDLSKGFITLPRDIFNSWIGSDLDRLKWWVDLVSQATIKPKKIVKLGYAVTLDRGQLEASLSYLCERWHASKPTIIKFLNALQTFDYIVKHTLYRRITIITICEFDSYCGVGYTPFYNSFDNPIYSTVDTNIKRNKKEEKNNTLEDARACARVEDFDALVAETFASRAQLEQYCMTEGITPEQCRQLARAVTNEWQMTGVTHTDTTDARRHLLAAIRAKARAKRAEAAARPKRTREEADAENYRAAMERIANSIKNSRI